MGRLDLDRAFDGSGRRWLERPPVARELGRTSIVFLVHPTLTAARVEKTCGAIAAAILRATG